MSACGCSNPGCRIHGCMLARGPQTGCAQIPPTTTVKWPLPLSHEPQRNPEAEWVRQIVREEIERALANREAGK